MQAGCQDKRSRAGLRAAGMILAGALASGPAAASEVIRAHGISTFGELQYPADYPHLAYVNPDAPKGGEISVWAFGGFDSMNPYSIKGRAGGLSTIFYESLLEGTADEVGAAYCLLCESIEYPEDRSWVIFHLRPEARFSDGTPVTPEDVIFSYETFLEKGLTDFRTVLRQQVASAEIVGDHAVRFTFVEGGAMRDLPQRVGGLSILSKADYLANGRDLEEGSLEPFIGSGPYTLERMNVGQTLVYRRNPDYWGWHLPMMQGRANFDRIRVEYYADYNSAFEGFKGGSYTFRNEASSILWATGYDFPAVAAGHVRLATLPNGNRAPGQAFLFNLRREKFQDPRVREAIGLMFNFEWSNETLFYGLYARIHSIWENSYLEAVGLPSEAEKALLAPLVAEGLLEASILTDPPVMAPVSGSRQLDRDNLRLASALLDEAGWTLRPPPPRPARLGPALLVPLLVVLLGATALGVRRMPAGRRRQLAGAAGVAVTAGAGVWLGLPVTLEPDGMRRNDAGELLRVEFLNDSQSFERIIAPYVENLRRLGVDAVQTRIDNAQMEARTRPPSYDMDIITGNARASLIPGADLKQFYGSETADVSAFNVMGLKSMAVDRLIEHVIAAESMESLTTAVHALDRVLRAERFWVPQWFKDSHTVAYFDMYEHPETLPPFALGELDFWWYNPRKAAALRAAGVLR